MPRRRVIAKREVLPDPKFNNQVVAKFINPVSYTHLTLPTKA